MGTSYSKSENAFRVFMILSGWLYLLGGLAFLFASRLLFDLLGAAAIFLARYFPAVRPLPYPSEHFWLILAVGYMMLLALACFLARVNVKRTECRNQALIVVAGKKVSSLLFLALFLVSAYEGNWYAAYLAGFAVDFLLLLLTLHYYGRAIGNFEIGLSLSVPRDEPFHPEGRTTFELWAVEGRLQVSDGGEGEGRTLYFTHRFVADRDRRFFRLPALADQMVLLDPAKKDYRRTLDFIPVPQFFLAGAASIDERDLDISFTHLLPPLCGSRSRLKYVETTKTYHAQFPFKGGLLELRVQGGQAPFLLGRSGHLEMGEGRVNGYVYPSCEASGSLVMGGIKSEVKAELYLEHLWGQMDMFTSYKSWYWFIIFLDNGLHVVLYWLEELDGHSRFYVHLQHPSGVRETLFDAEVKGLTREDSAYCTTWEIEIPERAIALRLETETHDQMMPGFLWISEPYWDGCFENVTGTVGGAPVKGFATCGMQGESRAVPSSEKVELPHPIAAYKEDEALVGKLALLDKVLEQSEFFEDLEKKLGDSRKTREEFMVVIKPNLMMLTSHEDEPVTYTDPELVEHLVEQIYDHGFRTIRVVEAKNVYGVFFRNRDVRTVAGVAGYHLDSPKYVFVDLSDEQEPCDFEGTDMGLKEHAVGRTWRDADYRISFAKNKTHILARYTLTLKNIYGTLPKEDKPAEYHFARRWEECTLDLLRKFPVVDFGFIDAYTSADGMFGLLGTDDEKHTKMILGGCNLAAVDIVGSRMMGYDPFDSSILRLYVGAFGYPRITGMKTNVEEGYRYPNWDVVINPHCRLYLLRKFYELLQRRFGTVLPPLMDALKESFVLFSLLFAVGATAGTTVDFKAFPLKDPAELAKVFAGHSLENIYRIVVQILTWGPKSRDVIADLGETWRRLRKIFSS